MRSMLKVFLMELTAVCITLLMSTAPMSSMAMDLDSVCRDHCLQYQDAVLQDDRITLQFVCRNCAQVAVQNRYTLSAHGSYAGMFAIPALDYYLPLYQGAGSDWQAITDAEDSGCLIVDTNRWQMPVLADHVNQGFGVIKSAVIGETVAVFAGEAYICTVNADGWNRKSDLETLDGVKSNALQVDLLTYTCNADGTVRLVGWQKR